MRCRVWVQALGQNQIQRYFKHFSGPCITPLLPEGEEHIFTLTGKTQYLQKLWSLTDGNRRCGKHQLLIPGFPTICIDVNSQALKHLKTSIICMEEIMGNPRKDEKVDSFVLRWPENLLTGEDEQVLVIWQFNGSKSVNRIVCEKQQGFIVWWHQAWNKRKIDT